VPCAVKQIINVVQFWKASKIVSDVDYSVPHRYHFMAWISADGGASLSASTSLSGRRQGKWR
jgi:hypothetical protein